MSEEQFREKYKHAGHRIDKLWRIQLEEREDYEKERQKKEKRRKKRAEREKERQRKLKNLNQSLANSEYNDTDDTPLTKEPQQDISSVTVEIKEEEQQSNDNSLVQ